MTKIKKMQKRKNLETEIFAFCVIIFEPINNKFLRERGMAFKPKMEYRFYIAFSKRTHAMATLALKEMGKLLWEGRENILSSWLS